MKVIPHVISEGIQGKLMAKAINESGNSEVDSLISQFLDEFLVF